MNLIILPCLLGVATAIPQGYKYQALQHPVPDGQVQLPSASQFVGPAEQMVLQQALQAPRVQQVLAGGGASTSYSSSSQKNQASIYQQQPVQLGESLAFNGLPQTYQPQQQHLVSKDIYVHVPPAEESDDRYPQPVFPPEPLRKHYRIVFIKTPTPSVSKASLRIKQAPVEEKTVIYVLTKKPDPLELQTAIEEIAPKQPSKPEVFFIKYKTQEEAAHAQRSIQAQYDKLGGSSQISDEGVAPVTSVIGVLDNERNRGTSTAKFSGSLVNNYLPANLRT